MDLNIKFILTLIACMLSYYIGYKVGVYMTFKNFIQRALKSKKK